MNYIDKCVDRLRERLINGTTGILTQRCKEMQVGDINSSRPNTLRRQKVVKEEKQPDK